MKRGKGNYVGGILGGGNRRIDGMGRGRMSYVGGILGGGNRRIDGMGRGRRSYCMLEVLCVQYH